MMKKTIQIISKITIIIILSIIVCIPKSQATTISPIFIDGDIGDVDVDTTFADNIVSILTTIGILLAVGVMMVIGIKYISGSLEEKAAYKKTMMPYLVGCFLIFSASVIAPQIIEIFKEANSTEEVGNIVLGIIQLVGTVVTVAVLMLLGIKYMIGSADERASYKKTMLPYVVGCILLFGAVNLTAFVYDTLSIEAPKSGNSGLSDGKEYIDKYSVKEIRAKLEEAKKRYQEAQDRKEPDQNEIEYWKSYVKILSDHLKWINDDATSFRCVERAGKKYCGYCGDELSNEEKHAAKCYNCKKNIIGI